MGYRAGFVIYFLLVGILFIPYLSGEVVAPTLQHGETGGEQGGAPQGYESNIKFNDYTLVYIPEITENLRPDRSGWLGIWTTKTELGRPTFHLSGFSPAYPPSWLLARFTTNPWRYITILGMFTCTLAGLFVMLFCREQRLHSVAGLVSASSIAGSPLFLYWLSFPMFPAAWCWSAGILWAVTRMSLRRDLIAWLALALCCHSMFLMAYPQLIIYQAYILGGYMLVLIYRKRNNRRDLSAFIALSLSAALAGAALAWPVYSDLLVQAENSTRISAPTGFFVSGLPDIQGVSDLLRFVVTSTVPEILGHTISPTYPLIYDGVSSTLLALFFVIIAIFVALRQTWGWCVAIILLCLLAFVRPVYAFFVNYLGFNLSRTNPLGSLILPMTIMVAYGADSIWRCRKDVALYRATAFATAGAVIFLALGIYYSVEHNLSLRWGIVAVFGSLIAILVVAAIRPAFMVAIGAICIVFCSTAYPLLFHASPAAIETNSRLIKIIRNNLPTKSRYAVVGSAISVLNPNFNATVGLPSVHSYDSLSSRRYRKLIEELGGKTEIYGRWNNSISPDYDSVSFWMSNIGIVLSSKELRVPQLRLVATLDGVWIYNTESKSRMGAAIQVPAVAFERTLDGVDIVDPRNVDNLYSPTELADHGDSLDFGVQAEAESVLIVSQQFHADWRAKAKVGGDWRDTQTLAVNGAFQGVIVPEGATRVRLEFLPRVRYAWWAHIFWALALVAAVASYGQKWWKARRKINGT